MEGKHGLLVADVSQQVLVGFGFLENEESPSEEEGIGPARESRPSKLVRKGNLRSRKGKIRPSTSQRPGAWNERVEMATYERWAAAEQRRGAGRRSADDPLPAVEVWSPEKAKKWIEKATAVTAGIVNLARQTTRERETPEAQAAGVTQRRPRSAGGQRHTP